MSKKQAEVDWEQLPLFEGEFTLPEGEAEDWSDQQWECDRDKALECIRVIKAHVDACGGDPKKAPPIHEEQIGEKCDQYHVYVRRRLLSAWRRRYSIKPAGKGYWTTRVVEETKGEHA